MARITPLDTPEAHALARALASGTNAKPGDYRILWMGAHVALVHWRGSSFYASGRTHRIHGTVTLQERRGLRPRWRGPSKTYLEVRRTPDVARHDGADVGMLTRARLAGYIADAKQRDADWPAKEAAEKAKKAAEKAARAALAEKIHKLAAARDAAHRALLEVEDADVYEAARRYRAAVAALKHPETAD